MTNGTFAELRQELQESKAKAQQLRIDNDRLTVTIEQNEQQMSSLKTEIEELRLVSLLHQVFN